MTTLQILALVIAAIVLAPLSGAMVWYGLRTHYTWVQFPFWLLYLFYTRIMWRATISGPIPVKPGEGAVIVCNHSCPLDPAFIQMGLNRLVHWMVAREYSRHWFLGRICRILHVIPANRSGVDTAATKAAIRLAEQGELVGLFPEGKINDTPELLLPGRLGAALIALKAGVPVIPCYVSGAPYDGTALGCLLMRARVHLEVGEPLDLAAYRHVEPDREVQAEVTRLIMKAIARLAGRPDYEPRLAGKRWNTTAEEQEEQVE